MGYRLYLAKMPKKEYEEMLTLSKEDFLKKYAKDGDDDYVGIYNFTTKLHGLGKYVDYSEGMTPVVFDDNGLNEMFDEYSFHILDKSIIKNIINEYSDNTANYYKSLIDGIATVRFFGLELGKQQKTPEERIQDIELHLLSKYRQHLKRGTFNIESGPVTHSWEYEYVIFELIRIYREFNEEEDVLLYYGY